MNDREKVIKWLAEEAVEHKEEEVRGLAHTALLMLKEQEARVLSWEEVKKSGSAYRCVEIYSAGSEAGPNLLHREAERDHSRVILSFRGFRRELVQGRSGI